MERPSLWEALRERPKDIETLERIREMYVRKIEAASREELMNLLTFFQIKEMEEIAHEEMLRKARPTMPHLVTDELMAYKSKSVIFWRGLREECERRLGLR